MHTEFTETFADRICTFCNTKFFITCKTWVFNPPLAPQFAGALERLIRISESLRYIFKTTGTQQLTPPTMETFTTAIGNIRNKRPLETATSDNRHVEHLKPNHFLLGRPLNIKPAILTKSH